MFKLSKILLITLLLLISSCNWFKSAGLPFFAFTDPVIPKGTPAFQRGFRDGCSTATYTRANDLYRAKNKFIYDARMIDHPEYRFGHQKGYSVCFVRSLGDEGPNSSFDSFIAPKGGAPAFLSRDINEAWGGMFKTGLTPSITGGLGNGLDGVVNVFSGGSGKGVFSADPIWAGGSKGQIFGQSRKGGLAGDFHD